MDEGPWFDVGMVMEWGEGEGCSPCAQRHVARGHGRLYAAHCFEALGGG